MTLAVLSRSAVLTRARPVPRLLSKSVALMPLMALALYAVALLPRAAGLTWAAFLNSDAPAAAYQAVSLSGGAHLALHTELLPMLTEGGLLRLPGGHLAIQLLGPVLALLTVGLLCRTVWRLGASWVVTLVAGLAAGPILLWSVLFPTAHVYTFLATAALAFTICAVADGTARGWTLAVTGVVAGIALVGDQGFMAMGLLPFLTAGGAIWILRRQWHQARAVGIVLAICAVVTVLAEAVIHAMGVTFVGGAFFGSLGVGRVPLGTSIVGAVQALGEVVGGQWSGVTLAQPSAILADLAGALVILIAPAALLVQLRHNRTGEASTGRVAYLFFWSACDLLVVGAFVIFGYAQNGFGAHYLLPCLISAVATLPLVTTPGRAWLPRLGATLVAGVAASTMFSVSNMAFAGPHPPVDGAKVVAVLRSAGLTKGYADYWESHPLTWLSGESVHVYPVDVGACSSITAAPNICRYEYVDDAWYVTVPGPTFLITRRSYPCVNAAPASVLGQPVRSITVDADTTILVYSYDIAARFASPAMTTCAD
jgi:hypothetical protein